MIDPGPSSPTTSWLRRPGCWITVLTILPLLVGGLYVAVNWFGAKELARVKSELAATGIELDPQKIPSDRPLDAENFCAVPLLLAIGSGTAGGPEMLAIKRIADWHSVASKAGTHIQSVRYPAPTDWVALRDTVAAADPAAGLEATGGDPVEALSVSLNRDLAPVFAELAGVLSRPQSCMVPTYSDQLRAGQGVNAAMVWINDLRAVAMVCYLRATLGVETGESDRVVESIRVLLRLAEGAEAYGTSTAGMVGISIRSLALNLVWSTAARNLLSAPAARELASALSVESPLDRLAQRIHYEMVFVHLAVESLRTGQDPLWLGESHLFGGFIPRGWYDANEAHVLDIYHRLSLRVQDSTLDKRFSTEEWVEPRMREPGYPWHNFLSRSLMSSLPPTKWVQSGASNHATCRLAEAACALELFHHKHQSYPESLSALVPEFMSAVPIDLDGKPIRYARVLANARYRLWSSGLDGVDDGGVEKAEGGGRPKAWTEPVGDWVWQYPQ